MKTIKRITPVFVLCVTLLLLSACNKSLREKVRFKGRSVDWFNRSPVYMSGYILGQTSSTKMDGYLVGNIYTDNDGYFDETFAAARSNEYYIYFTNAFGRVTGGVVREGNTFNYGEILTPHHFVCKMHLVRNPGSTLSVKFSSGSTTPYGLQRDTSVYETKAIAYSEFGANYPLTYTLVDSQISQTVNLTLPIAGDTIETTIRY